MTKRIIKKKIQNVECNLLYSTKKEYKQIGKLSTYLNIQ